MGGWTTTSFVLGSWLFLRLLGIIYLIAFVSLALQIPGLIGRGGILPATEYLARRRRWGVSRFWRVPTLCWVSSTDGFILGQAWAGALLSLCLILGLAPMAVLVALWILYLSLFSVSRIFLGYQWDILLLETGFLAIFLAPPQWLPEWPPRWAAPPLILWLFWWLLFRLMFFSGVMKLRSQDSSWRKLVALKYHYETQPLPTPAAWFAHQMPLTVHKVSTLLTLTIEVLMPFLIFFPPARPAAAFAFIFLMVLIQFTGNYCFFNLLGIALSVLLLDDHALLPAWQAVFSTNIGPIQSPPPTLSLLSVVITVVILLLSIEPFLRLFGIDLEWPGTWARPFEFFERLRLVNSYGLFSFMTRDRPEIIIEGSREGTHWQAYEFKWKPGNPERAPPVVAPHQPRLDWQMWFAALGQYETNPWFKSFLRKLLEGAPPVLALLKINPFPDHPPRFIRAVLYDYRFTRHPSKRKTGQWWTRERRGPYSPALELADVIEPNRPDR